MLDDEAVNRPQCEHRTVMNVVVEVWLECSLEARLLVADVFMLWSMKTPAPCARAGWGRKKKSYLVHIDFKFLILST